MFKHRHECRSSPFRCRALKKILPLDSHYVLIAKVETTESATQLSPIKSSYQAKLDSFASQNVPIERLSFSSILSLPPVTVKTVGATELVVSTSFSSSTHVSCSQVLTSKHGAHPVQKLNAALSRRKSTGNLKKRKPQLQPDV